MGNNQPLTYSTAGVDDEPEALSRLIAAIRPTLQLRCGMGEPLLDVGHFANLIRLTNDLALALAADGVGTKLLVAQMTGQYETIGIDCVAMNANDLLCVGAEPIALVDYLAVEELDGNVLESIGIGLAKGAVEANVVIAGGELAQLREIVKGTHEGVGFDLAAMCVGVVQPSQLITGANLEAGDVLIGLPSSGIHSNGFTLARRVLFDRMGWNVDKYVPEFGRTVGEELLEPTRIYVAETLELIRSDVRVKALAHITGGGFLNLLRTTRPAHLVIEKLPARPPIFDVIQQLGGIPEEEMPAVFNLGVGFSITVARPDTESALNLLEAHGADPFILGEIKDTSSAQVDIVPHQLVGSGNRFNRI